MPEMSEFPPGLPSWADLSTPDIDESVSFYGELFGWEAKEGEDPEEMGGYRLFTKDDKQADAHHAGGPAAVLERLHLGLRRR